MSDILNQKRVIGNRLRDWINTKYGKSSIAAAALQMSYQALSQYLRGERIPGNKVKSKLAELGADVDYIMTGRSAPVEEVSGYDPLTLENQGQRLKIWIEQKYFSVHVASELLGVDKEVLLQYIKGALPIETIFGNKIKEVSGEGIFLWILNGSKAKEGNSTETIPTHPRDPMMLELVLRLQDIDKKYDALEKKYDALFKQNFIELRKIVEESNEEENSKGKNFSNSTETGISPTK